MSVGHQPCFPGEGPVHLNIEDHVSGAKAISRSYLARPHLRLGDTTSSDVNDLGAETCASMSLYAGETVFNGEKIKDAVSKMILAKRLPIQNTFTSV